MMTKNVKNTSLLMLAVVSFIISLFVLTINVRADGYDTTAPVINSITIDKAAIKAPASFSLTFDITEEETGVSKIMVYFSDKNGIELNNQGISSNLNDVDFSKPFYSGSFSMPFTVSPDYPATTIRIDQIHIFDQQGNERVYFNHIEEDDKTYITDCYDFSIKCLINNKNNIDVSFDGDRDTIAPIIKSAAMNKTSLKAPGDFSITLDIIEDGTGLSDVFFFFMDKHKENRDLIKLCPLNERISCDQSIAVPLKTGKHAFNFQVSERYTADSIQIAKIEVRDQQGNKRKYYNFPGIITEYGVPEFENCFENGVEYIEDIFDSANRCYFYSGNNIDVTTDWSGEGYDITAPMIKTATLDKTVLKAPGVFSVTFDIVEEGSGVDSIGIWFYDAQNHNKYLMTDAIVSDQNYNPISDSIKSGKYTMKFRISSSCISSSIYIMQISIKDKDGNNRNYQTYNANEFYDNDGRAYLPDQADASVKCYVNNRNIFDVVPEFEVAFHSYITKIDNADNLRSMPSGKTAMINYDNRNHIARKELYDAIRGEDKTIVFSNNEYQWIINGRDIKKEAKDIDLLFRAEMIKTGFFGSIVPVIKIDFADNGILPGKTEIRMKSDYLYSMGISGNLLLYYLQGSHLVKEQNPMFNLILDGTDKWCHFDLYHNSTFYVTNLDAGVNISIDKEDISSFKVSGIVDKSYTGKKIKQNIKLSKTDKMTKERRVLKKGADYTVSYKNNIKVGIATIIITGKGSYKGKIIKSFKINKANNPLNIKGKTAKVKLSALEKKNKVLKAKSIFIFTKKGQGTLTYKKKSGNKSITVNSKTGAVTVKKGIGAGIYKVKVRVKAAGNNNYKPSKLKTVTFIVKVLK